MKIGQYVGWAWELYKSDYITFIIITLFGLLFILLSFGILTGPVMCGFMNVVFRKARGQRAEIRDFLGGFENLGERILAGVIALISFLMGSALLIIPGVMLAGIFCLVFPMMADRKMIASEAFRNATEIWVENIGSFSILALVAILLSISGLMMLFFGVLIFMPVAYATIAAAYMDYVGLENRGYEES